MAGLAKLLVVSLTLSCAVAGPCPWEDASLLRWSDKETWDSGLLPEDGDSLEIRKGILFDVVSPKLRKVKCDLQSANSVIVQCVKIVIYDGGSLVFTPHAETRLTADHVIIKANGSMILGWESCSFEAETEILLTGELGMDTSMGHYTKGISVEAGGSLDIHGSRKLSWTKLAATLLPSEWGEVDISLVDCPGKHGYKGWNQGDVLVIASTDYDMYQAEEVEVVSCAPCVDLMPATCTVRPLAASQQLQYSHFGEIYKGVDMRAEVGLLTRNIKIRGEVKDELDTYGGHVKAYEGFEIFRIEGAELTQMGQKGHKGRYPIHWHMAKEVDPLKTYARSNSIHHVFQRCITVHGTHGVTVEDNVAYNTFGHCYFLEDGGEKNNTFHHNLGLLTQFGTTIPSDRMPATFWVTSPLNFLTENSAAGSQGMGIWYIFADKVTGPSASEGFFQDGESFHTQIKTFRSNTVHSNLDTGFMFGHELLPDQDFGGPGGTDKE